MKFFPDFLRSAFIRRIGNSKSYNFLNDSNLSFQDSNEKDYSSENNANQENQVSYENGLTNRSLINLNLNKSYDTNKFNHSDGKSINSYLIIITVLIYLLSNKW